VLRALHFVKQRESCHFLRVTVRANRVRIGWLVLFHKNHQDPPQSLQKACDKCGDQASDTMPASLWHGASQQTALLRPRCTSAANRISSSCCTDCNAGATIVLEATSGKAKLDMATSGRGRRQPDELQQSYRLAEGSWPGGMASRRGHSNAPNMKREEVGVWLRAIAGMPIPEYGLYDTESCP